MSRETPLFPVQDSSIRENLEDITKRLALIESLGVIEKTTWLASPSRVLNLASANTTNWTNLDLSSYTTSKTKFVIITMYIKHSVAEKYLELRKNGDTPSYTVLLYNPVADKMYSMGGITVGCDDNQIIEYHCSVANADNLIIDLLGYIEQVEVS
jgi:hypothetical protein